MISSEEKLTVPGFGAGTPKMEMENCAAMAAILRLRQEGVERLGVRNFASAKNPGGFDRIVRENSKHRYRFNDAPTCPIAGGGVLPLGRVEHFFEPDHNRLSRRQRS